MGSRSPAQATTVTQSASSPWAAQQPFLETGFQQAQENVLDRPLEYFPGAGVVPFSSQTERALSGIEDRAVTGSPLNTAAQDYTTDVLGGKFVDAGNPHLAAIQDSIKSTIGADINSQFAGSGRYGSPAHAGTMARGMTDALAPHAFGNYERERSLQQAAANMAPQMAQLDYSDFGALQNVGQAREALGQAQLQDEINRFEFSQREPGSRIGDYMGLVGGGYGGSGTTSSTVPVQRSNPIMQALGMGSQGLGMANVAFNPTYGLFR